MFDHMIKRLDKEAKEILWEVFVEECFTSNKWGDSDSGVTYEDNGGAIIHESQMESYYNSWLESQTAAELTERIEKWTRGEL
jgi:hypothetical protein